jgi:hypothetical protein
MPSTSDTYSLAELLRAAEEQRQTLSVVNYDGPDHVLATLQEYFDAQSLVLRTTRTESRKPANFAVLHDDDEFLGAAPVEDIYHVARPDADLVGNGDVDELDCHRLFGEIDQSVFADYGERRMIAVSRAIEQTAWEHRAGELHAGFQSLSKLRHQWRIYRALADTDVEVHVYGRPDWTVPDDRFDVHGDRGQELARHWFVVFISPNGDDRALLAQEREPGRFFGVWTTRTEFAQALRRRLHDRYL